MPDADRTPTQLLLHGLVVTLDRAGTILEDGGVAIGDREIVAVGPSAELEARYGERAESIVDAGGQLILPGLVNLHSHAADALFRGLFDDLPLEPWLERLWRVERRFLTPETVGLGTRLAFAEMVRAGITTSLDMFWFPEVAAEAAEEMGFRLLTGPVFFDGAEVDGLDLVTRLARGREFLQHYRRHPLVTPCVLPHSTYTVSPEGLRAAQDLANEHDVLLTTHACETAAEVRTVRERYGSPPLAHLDALGLLHERTVLAHCVHLSEREIELLAERRCVVAHCPLSNLKLGSGVAPLPALLRAGVRCGLGTDGPVSGNDLDLWLALRLAAVLHKGVHGDPGLLPAADVLHLATRDAARALGLEHRIGSLEAGKRADLVLVDLERPHLAPLHDVTSHLVYAVGRGDVRSVFIDGRPVLRDRELLVVDEAALLAEIRDLAPEISRFAGGGDLQAPSPSGRGLG